VRRREMRFDKKGKKQVVLMSVLLACYIGAVAYVFTQCPGF
jgi:hypothetical protein